MEETLIVALVTYALMIAAFFGAKQRLFHMPVMISVIIVDLLFPFYLFFTRDWYRRLIEQQEIFSFLIWMHLILVFTLYGLYVLQVMTARKMLRGEMDNKPDHRSQGIGILVTRGLVVLTGALLIEPETTPVN